ncbi:MAG: hypothetical protein O9972_39795 [Burkholderiales bacterium]|nr:hypothetical protein [Burkholderiales bacterium]
MSGADDLTRRARTVAESIRRPGGKDSKAGKMLNEMAAEITAIREKLASAVGELDEVRERLAQKHREVEELRQDPLFRLKEDMRSRAEAAEAALEALEAESPELLCRVHHKKRGSTYRVLGEAEAQVTVDAFKRPIGLGRVRGRMLVEGDNLVVYRCEETGKLWARFPDEFNDGRFEVVP